MSYPVSFFLINFSLSTPLKKIAEARDIATQVVVLASPTLSGHVTGQTLMVEGGMEGRLLNNPEDVELPS